MAKPKKLVKERTVFSKNLATLLTDRKKTNKDLATLLTDRKKTNKDLATFVGISTESVRKYLTENVSPSTEVLKKIAIYFDVSADYLVGLIDTDSKDITDKEINKATGLSKQTIDLLRLSITNKKKYKYIQCINALTSENGLKVIDGIIDYLKLNDNDFSAVPDYGDSVYFGIKPQKDKSFLLSNEDVSLLKFIKIQNALKTLKDVIKEDK